MKRDTSWSNVAAWYFEHLATDDSYHKRVIVPNLTRAMNIQKGEYVLDLACGTGFFSEIFQSLGAQVTGIDISPELIELAIAHASKSISFHVAPSDNVKAVAAGSIDKVACVLAIQNIKALRETFSECRRMLRAGGKMYIVMNYRAFRIPVLQAGDLMSRRSGSTGGSTNIFQSELPKSACIEGPSPMKKNGLFHRPLQVYMKALASVGFAVTRLKSGSLIEAQKLVRAKKKRIACVKKYLCLCCLKRSSCRKVYNLIDRSAGAGYILEMK